MWCNSWMWEVIIRFIKELDFFPEEAIKSENEVGNNEEEKIFF